MRGRVMSNEEQTQELLKQAIAVFQQTSTMLDSLIGSNSSNLIDKHQAAAIVHKHWKTLSGYREKYWTEGIHYFPQPDGSYLYNRMLLEDWLVNWQHIHAHQKAIENWASTLPSNQEARKSRRGKAA